MHPLTVRGCSTLFVSYGQDCSQLQAVRGTLIAAVILAVCAAIVDALYRLKISQKDKLFGATGVLSFLAGMVFTVLHHVH